MGKKDKKEAVLTYIGMYGTKSKPVRSKVLEDLCGLTGAGVRNIVRELRRSGEMIGIESHEREKRGGYYLITEYDDFIDTIKNLEGRRNSLSITINTMKDKANEYFGKTIQMRLI